MTDLPFEGRVALVAGASRGIGAATAEAFAAAGAAVVLGARDMAALESVVKRIEANGGRALAVRSDVADVDSARELAEATVTAFGRLATLKELLTELVGHADPGGALGGELPVATRPLARMRSSAGPAGTSAAACSRPAGRRRPG